MSSSPISCTSYSKHHRQLRFKDYSEVTGWQVPDYVTFNPPRAMFRAGRTPHSLVFLMVTFTEAAKLFTFRRKH